ncbi:MAG: hypothetical protein JXB42_01380 [Deltaproteobacteria bacterium]|nr:hypothetical protein [Deltaproteobacteria bacterium]
MVIYQVSLPGLAGDCNHLTKQDKDFIAYFFTIDMDSISLVIEYYAGIGPKGYNVFLILARIIKIKERVLSDRQLADVLKKNDLYRFVTRDIQPAHNTFNTLRKRLGPRGFVEIPQTFRFQGPFYGTAETGNPQIAQTQKEGNHSGCRLHVPDHLQFHQKTEG